MNHIVLRMPGYWLQISAAILVALLEPNTVLPQDSSSGKNNQQVLTRVHDIRTLTPDEAKQENAVHLRAVVTYYGGFGWELFIHDLTAGIYVDASDEKWAFKAGDLIELDGTVAPGGFAPDLVNVRIQVLGRTALPTARRVTLPELLTGKEDGQWVEIEGILRSAQATGQAHTTLEIGTSAGRFRAEIPGIDPQIARMVDSRILLRGACGASFNKKRQLTGVQLYVPDLALIQVLEPPPPDPFLLPLRPINTLLQFTPGRDSSHRIRIQGVVTLQRLGRSLFLEDETQGLYALTGQSTPLQAGDLVDVVGFPSVGEYTPVLEQAVFRRLGTGTERKAKRITSEQALLGDFDAELVQIEAEVKDQLVRAGEQVFILSADNRLFEATQDTTRPDLHWPSLKNNSWITMTGVCSVQVGEDRVPRSFRILLRTPEDIKVLRQPSWWTVGRALYLLGFIVAISFLAFGWILILKRRVKEQTETIRQRLECEVALEKRFQYVARATNDAVWDLDLTTNAIWWNEGLQTIFGYQESDIDPTIDWWVNLLHPEDRERVTTSLEKATTAGTEKWSAEYRFRRVDGTYAHVFDRGYVIHDEAGKPTRMIGAMMDVSAQKEAQEALRHAKEAAESANRAKSAFLANMSHEIRTPMNGILGTAELLLDTELTFEQRELVKMAKSSADSLLTVINDILDFSKIEAGKLSLDHIEFDLRRCLEETMKAFAPQADAKGLELACDVREDVSRTVVGDPTRLRQIIVNLVGNAIKFTEHGEIVLVAETEAQHDSSALLRFTVRDTGIGIPADKQASIFKAFAQADNSTTRKYGGTGLGLTISTRLVEMMAGKMWVESEVGRGSRFHFNARFGITGDTTPLLATDQAGLSGLRVLIVDDNETNRRILQTTLERWQMRVESASTGSMALAALREAQGSGQGIPLVLTDAHMPGMDGFELSEKIKKDQPLADSTIIMMITSGGQRGDAARCREIGVAAYLTKPVIQSELREAILKVISQPLKNKEPNSLVTIHSLADERQGLCILLAEDNRINQRLVSRLLEKRAHRVTVAGNGLECLEAIRKDSFDLVLMDVQMPEMDGCEAVHKLREIEKDTGNHLVVFALTAHAISSDRDRCLAAGMDDYLSKPVRSQELFAAIERHFPSGNPQPSKDVGGTRHQP